MWAIFLERNFDLGRVAHCFDPRVFVESRNYL